MLMQSKNIYKELTFEDSLLSYRRFETYHYEYSTRETCFKYFLEIRERVLKNYLNILKKRFVTDSGMWIMNN